MIDIRAKSFGPFVTRGLIRSDAVDLYHRITGDPRVMRYMPNAIHTSLEEARKAVVEWNMGALLGVYGAAITLHGEFVGVVTAEFSDRGVCIGLKFAQPSKGAGRLFGIPFTAWLLAHRDIHRVWAWSAVENTKVNRVFEKSNARLVGVAKKFAILPNINPNEPQDCCIWEKTRP